MATIRGHDLQLQSVQKIITKAMIPLVRLADSFVLAEAETLAMHSPTEALNACFLQVASQCKPADRPNTQRLLYRPATRI